MEENKTTNDKNSDNVNTESAAAENNADKNAALDTAVKKKSAVPVIIISAVAVVIVAAVLIAVVLFASSSGEKSRIADQLALGDRYLSEMDYDQAIAAYLAVLEIDPNNRDAYERLAEAYMAQADSLADSGDKENAIVILENAYTQMSSMQNDDTGEYITSLTKKINDRTEELQAELAAEQEELHREEEEKLAEDTEEALAEELVVIPHLVETYDVDSIVGDSWFWRLTSESIVCFDYTQYDAYGVGEEYKEDWQYRLTMRIYDYDGNLVKEVIFDDVTAFYEDENGSQVKGKDKISNFTVNVLDHYHENTGIVLCFNTCGPLTVYLYDYLGNFVKEMDATTIGYLGCDWNCRVPIHVNETADEKYLAVMLPDWSYENYGDFMLPDYDYSGRPVPLAYINCEKGTFEGIYDYNDKYEIVRVIDSKHELISAPEYDEEKFMYCSKQEISGDVRYFIETVDEKWGYADEDFNILKLYEDASAFNIYGFALVSEDGSSYDLIDADFNIVEKDFAEGQETHADRNRIMLVIKNGDEQTYYLVKGEN